MTEKLIQRFKELYGKEGEVRAYFAPGRVNLIGEHTDYNGGHVFPCALTLGTYGIVRDREDRVLRFYSANFEKLGVIETSLDDLIPDKAAGWTNYPKGVMWAFEKRGYQLTHGMDILIYGNIPNGSGLSSSASLEVLTGLILKDTFGFEQVSMIDVALIGQDSENNFNGCNCGIMDQFASAMGKKDHAIFLDTNTLNYEYAPVVLEDAKIVITNSKVKHSLVNSAYNDRRNECETALKELQSVVNIKTLGDLTEEEYEAHKDAIKDPVRQKRAKHAVYENQRTIRAVEALKNNDVELFGKLMNASHKSLRYDYEVSCGEIDILVDLAQAMPGVIGSRITGGGFGGCTVSIVKNDTVDAFIREIGKTYQEKVGHEAEFYVVEIGDGAKII
ncbi:MULTISPECIES: galactokinase [Lachnospiraceae]|uniref:galactokinase n=1 Tax=Lachnospiraceae TaxID=186803 RepID=UPI001F3B3176|nr:galactokinase [Faecalicatena contorta]MCF2668107.1 galactokinase [Faecalicatena contorta]